MFQLPCNIFILINKVLLKILEITTFSFIFDWNISKAKLFFENLLNRAWWSMIFSVPVCVRVCVCVCVCVCVYVHIIIERNR